jgi:hypothetical protein
VIDRGEWAARLMRTSDRMLELGRVGKAVRTLMLARRFAFAARDMGAVMECRARLWTLGRDGRGHRL